MRKGGRREGGRKKRGREGGGRGSRERKDERKICIAFLPLHFLPQK